MRSHKKYLFLLLTGAMFGIATAPVASASQNSAVVWPAEGNVQCSDYSANKIIESMNTGTLSAGATGTLSGAANPQDGDSDTSGETASYTLSTDGTTFSYTASTPINYVVLKSSKDVSVAIYKTGGVDADSDLTITRDGVKEPIDSVSLCYGLPDQQIATVTAPKCSDVGVNVTTTQPQVVVRYDVNPSTAPGKGYNPQLCVAGGATATVCDPALPAGQPGSCFPPGAPTGNQLIPTTTVMNPDPGGCTTSTDGTLTCYSFSY